MSFETIHFSKHKEIAWITLNRPSKFNAYDLKMRDELWQTFQAINEDIDVKAMIIKGEGKAFCAGADLSDFGTCPSPVVGREVRWKRDLWGLLYQLPVLTVALLHGYTVAGGLEMTLFCDFRYATPDTVFRMPEVGWGLLPSAGGTQTLPRIGRYGSILEMVFTGEQKSVDWALKNRLINGIVEKEKIEEYAIQQVEKVIRNNTRTTIKAVKRAVWSC